MNYTSLTGGKTTSGSIKEWVNYDLIPSAAILADAEAWIYQFMRCREMKAVATGTISTGDSTLDLSALDFLEPIAMKLTGSSGGRIDLLDEEHFESRTYVDDAGSLDSSTPTAAMVVADTMSFNFKADQDYDFRLVYTRRPPALAASTNETNFLTDRYSHILRAACLFWAFEFMKDLPQADRWERRAMQLIDKANDEFGMYMGALRYEKFWE